MTRALVTTLIVMALVPALSVGRSAAATPDLPGNVEFVGKLAIFSKYRLKSNGMPIYLAQNSGGAGRHVCGRLPCRVAK